MKMDSVITYLLTTVFTICLLGGVHVIGLSNFVLLEKSFDRCPSGPCPISGATAMGLGKAQPRLQGTSRPSSREQSRGCLLECSEGMSRGTRGGRGV